MFETVAPEITAPRSRKLFYESLPMSLFAHAAVGAILLVGSTWEVSFPNESPRQHMMYALEMLPTPPPAPPAPAARQVAPEKPVAEERTVKPDEIVAPTIIPDLIPDVPVMEAVEHSVGEGTSGGAAVAGWTGPVGEGGTGDSELGVPGGVEGSVGEQLPPNTVLVKRHQQLPRSMTPMSMVYPFYPEEARMRGWEDAVTVRYTIGRDGRVKSVEVLDPPQRPLFEPVVVKAIRHWRFRPLFKEGVAQEVVHELVVYFKLAA
jgi:TonB family protein